MIAFTKIYLVISSEHFKCGSLKITMQTMAFIQVAHLLSVEKHIEIMRSILLIDTLTDAFTI